MPGRAWVVHPKWNIKACNAENAPQSGHKYRTCENEDKV